MSKKGLPIYQIPDFGKDHLDSSSFYYSKLSRHLEKHKFIQRPHKHDFYILMLITKGTGTHSIDFKSYNVNPDTVFFLRPGQVHFWQLSEDSEGHILFFSSTFYSDGVLVKKLDRFPFFGSSLYPKNLILNPENAKETELLFSTIDHENSSNEWSKKEILKSLTEILLIKLGRVYQIENGLSYFNSNSEDQFRHLESMIESEFRIHREASFYSDKMNFSLKQLNRLTKVNTKKTISQLLLDRVILESQRLLTYSDLSISEIASYLGFEDPSYFTRLFKKKIGNAPEVFRKSIK